MRSAIWCGGPGARTLINYADRVEMIQDVLSPKESTMLLPLVIAVVLFLSSPAVALKEVTGESQREYEKSVEAIVRNKHFYKSGRLEVGFDAGTMPYDSIVNHYMFGGRAAWHFSDHYGWELIDLQTVFPAVTGYALDLAREKGISNLQTIEIRNLVGTNFLLSPFYGKIRFLGVIYFDIYVVAGLGVGNTQTLKISSAATGVEPLTSVVTTGWDPMVTLGFGFKIFLNNAMGLSVDLRDHLLTSQIYGGKRLMSNFSVFGGLSFYLPIFG